MHYQYGASHVMEESILALLSGFFSGIPSFVIGIVTYIFTALALYTIAKRRCISKPWLSWIPVINCWIIGSLSDQYRYVVKGEVKNKRKTLLALNIITGILSVAMIVAVIVMIVGMIGAAMNGAVEAVILEAMMGPAFITLGLCLPLLGIGIATAVVRYIAMYDIYTSCTPQNNVLFLVLSILFPVTEPFFIFFSRNSDEGMPPRKTEPVYEAPQQTWNDTEYL